MRRSRYVGPHALLEPAATRVVEAAGLAARDRCDYVVALLEGVLVANAAEFVGVQETRDLVDALETTHPARVAEVVPRALTLAQVAEVLRRLVAEEVAIGDLRAIFEALAATSAHERDPLSLVEAVRARLWRQLTYAATGGAESLPVYLLSADVEAAVFDAAQLAEPGGPLPLDPSIVRALVGALGEAERLARESAAARPVVVVPREIRRHTRALLEATFPAVPVVAFQELAPSLSLRPIATLG
jgi:type III secretory pathway component EscV